MFVVKLTHEATNLRRDDKVILRDSEELLSSANALAQPCSRSLNPSCWRDRSKLDATERQPYLALGVEKRSMGEKKPDASGRSITRDMSHDDASLASVSEATRKMLTRQDWALL